MRWISIRGIKFISVKSISKIKFPLSINELGVIQSLSSDHPATVGGKRLCPKFDVIKLKSGTPDISSKPKSLCVPTTSSTVT